MKNFLCSVVAALMALTASAATNITVADYAATSFMTTDRHFAISAAKGEGASAPAYNGGGKDLRVYAKGILTIEAASEMTGIELTISAQGLKRLSAENTADCGTLVSAMAADSTSATVTWTGNSKKVVITVGEKATLGRDGAGKAGQLDFTALTIEGGTDGLLDSTMYQIDFKASKKDWTVDDKVLPEGLSYVWQQSSLYGYKASAYANSTNYATESWLISPVLDLQGHNATQATLNFTHVRKYGANEHLSVKITKDGTTWETLTFENWPTGDDWNFVEAGAVDITEYISDKTQFAFVYTSTATGAATWYIGSVTLISDGEPFETEKVSIANTPETAYTVSEAIALIDAGEGLSDTVYVKGKVDSIGTLSEQFRSVTIRFNDGTNSMLAYNCYGLNKDSIMSQADLDNLVKVGDDIIVVGTLNKYGNLYELNSRCWLYSVETVKDTVIMYDIDFKASKKDWTVDDKVLPEELSYVWQQSSQYGYKASAYANGTNYATESWLISPVLDLQGHNATQATLNFTHARKYGANEHLSVKITKDGTAWETLTFENWPTGNDWNFIEAGAVDITEYISDKTQFAFVYTSTATGAATWEIGSVTLMGDGDPFEVEEVSIANTPETAYTVSEAIALIDAGEGLSDTVYVKGKVDSIGTLSEQFRNVTIRFNDGTNSMLAYNCYGLNKDSIMSQTDLDNLVKIGDDIIVVGTLTKYGSLYEFNSRCWLYSVKTVKDTVTMYDIDFKASKKDWTVDDKVLPEELSYVWQQSSTYGYKASAYVGGTNYVTESWLISPVLDLQGHNATQAALNFTHARKYGANEHLSVKITKDGTAWETLTFENWPTGNDWIFIEAGAVDITEYISDKTQFAFVYTSTATSAATWEIGSVTLMGDGDPFEVEEVSIANTPETAYTVSEAIALIDAGEGLSDTVYVKGKVDSIGTLSDTYHNVTIRFNDGTNSMLAYNCYGLNKDSIMSQADLDNLVKIGDDIIVVGTLTKYGSLYEVNSRCWLYSVSHTTAIDEATIESGKAEKYFRNGVLYIRRNGIEYTVMGAKAE